MANGVQFKNKDQVLNAYQNNKIDTWAIFCGRELFTRGSDIDELTSALDLLEDGASNSVYTLRVYSGLNSNQVKSNTPNDGGFNFRLNGENMEVTNGQYMTFIKTNELQSKISGLEKKIEELQSELDESETPNKLGKIGEILDHPLIGKILENVAMTYLQKWIPGGIPGNQPAPAPPRPVMSAVGNIANNRELVEALERLQKHDDKLTEHMVKLAHIAENDAVTFTYIMSSLDKLQL